MLPGEVQEESTDRPQIQPGYRKRLENQAREEGDALKKPAEVLGNRPTKQVLPL